MWVLKSGPGCKCNFCITLLLQEPLPTALSDHSPLTPDAQLRYLLFGTSELYNMTMARPAYFLFLAIHHRPSSLHISLHLCRVGIHANYNKWKFLSILQDILCFYSHTNLLKTFTYERQSLRWFNYNCNNFFVSLYFNIFLFFSLLFFLVSFTLCYIVISRKFHSPCLIVFVSLDYR